MGYTFINIQLRNKGRFDKGLVDSIASSIANGRGWRPVDNPDEADLMTVITCEESGSWIGVSSDAFAGEPDAAIHAARRFSENLDTDALAIGCFDSDYLFLNMQNPSEEIDLWASTGSAAAVGLSGMRRSNFSAWRKRVKDVNAFKAVMKQQRVFAEECLNDLEQMLDLPASQSIGCGTDWPDTPGTYRYYYVAEEDGEADAPTALEWHTRPYYAPREGEESFLNAVNRGGASYGIGIAFMGEEVEKGDVAVYEAKIQVRDNRGEWKIYPIELKETVAADGRKMLYGELPHFPIPCAVSGNLPIKKRLDMEWQRSISLRYIPESPRAHLAGERLAGLAVYLIPLKNWQGQCGWRGHFEGNEF